MGDCMQNSLQIYQLNLSLLHLKTPENRDFPDVFRTK